MVDTKYLWKIKSKIARVFRERELSLCVPAVFDMRRDMIDYARIKVLFRPWHRWLNSLIFFSVNKDF